MISIASGRSLSISDVTIRNGDTSALGGGIYLKGVLDLTRCVVSGNRAGSGGGLFTETEATATIVKSHFTGNVSSMGGNGGGIFQDGNLTLHESTLDANIAGEEGGGIFNSRNFVMVASTVSGNTAVGGVGGGIVNYGNLLASNSTISDNRAYSGGAGIANLTVANVYNLTIVFNQSDYTGQNGDAGATGGINNYDVYGGVFNLRNTLVAGNFDGGSPAPHDCAGTLNAYGRNLIGVAGDRRQIGQLDQP